MKKIFFFLLIPFASLAQTPDATIKTNNDNWIRTAPLITGVNEATLFDQIVNSKLSRLENNTATGTNSYTITLSWVSSYTKGLWFPVQFQNSNTTSATININSLGIKSIKKGSSSLSAGDIDFTRIYLLFYEGTNFQLVGGASASSFSSLSDAFSLSGNGLSFVRVNSGGTALEPRTPSQVLSDISAVSTSRLINTSSPLSGGGALSSDLTISFPTWPSDASGALTNNGSGTLSWTPITSTLAGATDVNISSPSNNQFLRYKTSDNKWHNDSFIAGTDYQTPLVAGTDYEVPLTFSTGLTRSTNTITVNTSQNIAKLSNLTTNGFVKTSGGDGTLSIDNSTYLTGNQTITLSGDISGSGSTAITTAIGSGKVTNTMLAGSIAASKLVGTDIATVGTITAGTWNGTKISEVYGGTNQSSYTTGDILYANGTNTLSKLSANSTAINKYLQSVNSNAPSWQQIALNDLSGFGTGVATWLGTPSWTNFNSAITGTAPFVSLSSGGTATGTMTLTMGSNPFIITTTNSTGTGATAGLQMTANSLTTGTGVSFSTSSETTGQMLHVTSTSTAVNHTVGSNGHFRVTSSGANGTSSKTVIGASLEVTNTGTTSTNVGLVASASGASNNYAALFPNGNVGIGTNTPTALLEIKNTDTNINSVSDQGVLTHFLTSGTPASGIGTGFLFNTQTTSGGATKNIMRIAGVMTDVTSSAEDGATLIQVMSNGVSPLDRMFISGNWTALTESSATAFARININSNQSVGGEVKLTVKADDGTDYQCRTITFPFSAVNKAGTLTISSVSTTEAVAASTGTLTCTITAVDSGSGNLDFKANCTSSLTQTTLVAQFNLTKQFEGTISTQ